jgi:hypothetical protein
MSIVNVIAEDRTNSMTFQHSIQPRQRPFQNCLLFQQLIQLIRRLACCLWNGRGMDIHALERPSHPSSGFLPKGVRSLNTGLVKAGYRGASTGSTFA